VVEDFPAFRELRGRPLLAALYDRGQRIELETNRTNADDLDRLAVVVPARFARAHPEVYALQDGKVSTITPEGRRYWVVPTTTERLDVIACDPQRCFLVDAFDPRL